MHMLQCLNSQKTCRLCIPIIYTGSRLSDDTGTLEDDFKTVFFAYIVNNVLKFVALYLNLYEIITYIGFLSISNVLIYVNHIHLTEGCMFFFFSFYMQPN